MRTRVKKWGRGLALRIPRVLAIEAGLEDVGEVEPSVVVIPTVAPSYKLDELLARVRRSNLHKESDWGPLAGKEIW